MEKSSIKFELFEKRLDKKIKDRVESANPQKSGSGTESACGAGWP